MPAAIPLIVTGALVGGGVAAITGGDIGRGALLGGIGGGFSSAIGGLSSGFGGAEGAFGGAEGAFGDFGAGELFGGAAGEASLGLGLEAGMAYGGAEALGAALPASITSAADPIAALEALDAVGGYQGATAGAQALGYASPQAVLNYVNPMWITTPDASVGGMMNQMGQGVTPGEVAGQAGRAFGGEGSLGGTLRSGFQPIGGGINVAGMQMGVSPFDLAKGAYGLYQSKKTSDLAQKYAAQADPNAAYRPGYASQLNTIAQDPSSIYKLPGWEAGSEAVQRSMAAQGYQGSGNMAVAMQKYGQDFYNQSLNQYGALSGIGFNPANAAQIGMQGNTDAINLAGQSLNSLGYGAAGGANRRGVTFNY